MKCADCGEEYIIEQLTIYDNDYLCKKCLKLEREEDEQ